MQQSNGMLSKEESYAPTKWTEFLWWLATAEKELIKDCVIDRNRYAIIGTTVFCTWIFATLAWIYFFFIATNNVCISIAIGLFMGFIILSIDRALIKSINTHNSKKVAPFIFRLILAATIGTFMAQPALLYLFKKEIRQQISLDNELRKKEKLIQQTQLYAVQKQEWQQQKLQLQNELIIKYQEVAQARAAFIAETDGTGGSKKVGLYAIAKTKKEAYELLLNNYTKINEQLQPKIQQADSALLAIEQQIVNELNAYNNLLKDGFLTQIESLNNLLKTNTTLQFKYWLLLFLILLIELMPIIAKSLLQNGSYNKRVNSTELLEATLLQENEQYSLAIKQHFNKLAFEADKELITNFFELTKSKRKKIIEFEIDSWQNLNEKNYQSIWTRLQKKLLTKQNL